MTHTEQNVNIKNILQGWISWVVGQTSGSHQICSVFTTWQILPPARSRRRHTRSPARACHPPELITC